MTHTANLMRTGCLHLAHALGLLTQGFAQPRHYITSNLDSTDLSVSTLATVAPPFPNYRQSTLLTALPASWQTMELFR